MRKLDKQYIESVICKTSYLTQITHFYFAQVDRQWRHRNQPIIVILQFEIIIQDNQTNQA